ncbi:MAG: HD domain-containing protein, partial [Chloroflexi bacterium]|nr:HD domain-containing protein [Chloroflexota bacterium]
QTFLLRFTLIGLLATAAVATIFAYAISRALAQDALDREAQALADELFHFTPYLRPDDFTAPVTTERHAEIDADYRRELFHPGIMAFRIWTSDGKVLYEDAGDAAPRSLPPNFAPALAGTPSATLLPGALVYYVPVRFGNSAPLGIYELRVDPAQVEARLASLRRAVWAGVGLGFAVVYLALFGIAREASRMLVRRESEARERLFELEALFKVSTALRAARNVAEMLPIIVDQSVEVMRSDAGALLLLDETGEALVFEAARGKPEALLGLRHERCQDPLWQVLQSRQPLVSNDLEAVWANPGCETTRQLFAGLASCLCVPLHTTQNVPGLLFLGYDRRRLATEGETRTLMTITEMAGSAIQRARLFDEVRSAYLQTAAALANAVDAKDTYIGGHGEALSRWALAVGREMGLSEKELEDLRFGALLHDVGKIGVPDSILGKPGPLTPEEWAAMRRHPDIGREILQPVQGLQGVCDIVCHHHERFDGAGYPVGLAGEAIPLGARILAVVDAYGAITDERVYKPGRSHEEAVAELRRGAGTQFDPHVVEAFLKVIEPERGQAKERASFDVEPVLERHVEIRRSMT